MENNPKQIFRHRLIVGTVLALLALAVSAVLFSYDFYFTGLWVLLNLPAAFLGMMTSGNVHDYIGVGFYLGVAIQWFSIGVIVHRIYTVGRFRRNAA